MQCHVAHDDVRYGIPVELLVVVGVEGLEADGRHGGVVGGGM